MKRTLATSAAAAIMGVSALAVATPAHAADDNIRIVDGTYSQCRDVQRTYVSSWTKITRPCYEFDTGFGIVYKFHWRTIA